MWWSDPSNSQERVVLIDDPSQPEESPSQRQNESQKSNVRAICHSLPLLINLVILDTPVLCVAGTSVGRLTWCVTTENPVTWIQFRFLGPPSVTTTHKKRQMRESSWKRTLQSRRRVLPTFSFYHGQCLTSHFSRCLKKPQKNVGINSP